MQEFAATGHLIRNTRQSLFGESVMLHFQDLFQWDRFITPTVIKSFYWLVIVLIVLIGAGWRSGAMLATGTLISAASIWEWQRLIRVMNARMDKQKTPASAPVVVLFFVLRLTVFAGVIYGSLKCFQGSVVALLCGLCLAVVATAFEALRLLKD